MKFIFTTVAFAAAVGVLVSPRPPAGGGGGNASPAAVAAVSPAAQPARASLALFQAPLGFTPNEGQFHPGVRYAARRPGAGIFLTENGIRFALTAASAGGSMRGAAAENLNRTGAEKLQTQGANVFLTFDGSADSAMPMATALLDQTTNWFEGKDPLNWRSNVATASTVRWRGVWPGIDVIAGSRNGRMEYDLALAPGADISRAVIRCEGVDGLHVAADGSLVGTTALGAFTQTPPVSWQTDAGGARHEIVSHFRLLDATHYGFDAVGLDASLPSVVDPGIIYAGYLGGSGIEQCEAVTLDATGAAYVTGRTSSLNFPTTPGCYDNSLASVNGTQYDAFVTKINPAGSALVYSTYVGGPGSSERGYAIKVDSTGAAYVGGIGAANFPVTAGAFSTVYHGWNEGVVFKLNPAGSALVFSTYLGGTNEDKIHGIALDGSNNVVVIGETISDASFPTTTGAFRTTPAGGYDAFVSKLAATGASLLWSTRLGGSGDEFGWAVTVDPFGDVIAVGGTTSVDFPATPGNVGTPFGGSYDAFVTKFPGNGGAPIWSATFGYGGNDQGLAVTTDAVGDVYVAGIAGGGFPTTANVYQSSTVGGGAFAAKLNSAGTAVIYSTLLGASFTSQANAIAVDSTGRVVIGGWTNAFDFPVTASASQPTFNGGGSPAEGFLAKFDPFGATLIYSSYFGGAGYDEINGLAMNAAGNVVAVGDSNSQTLPTTAGSFGANVPPATVNLDNGFVFKSVLPASPSVTVIGTGCGIGLPATITATLPTLNQVVTISGANTIAYGSAFVVISGPGSAGAPLGMGCSIYWDGPTADILAVLPVNLHGQWNLSMALVGLNEFDQVIVRLQAVITDPIDPAVYEFSNAIDVQLGF